MGASRGLHASQPPQCPRPSCENHRVGLALSPGRATSLPGWVVKDFRFKHESGALSWSRWIRYGIS